MSKFIIPKGSSSMNTIKNEHISSLSIHIGDFNVVDLPNFDLKVTLKLNGKVFKVIFDDTLKVLSDINESRFDGSGILAIASNVMYLPFDTTLNLTNGFELLVEFSNKSIVPSASNDVTFNSVPSVGVMQFVPSYERIQLDANIMEHNLNLGSHVSKVVINRGASLLTLDTLTVKSDKLDAEYSEDALLTQFLGNLSNGSIHGEILNLVNDKHLQNDLSLRLKLKTAEAGREIYVVRNIYTPQIVTNYVRKTEQHNEQNLMQIKGIKTPDCACSK